MAATALGTRSWTELNGKVIEEGSLTDGKDYTDAGTPYTNNQLTEAFQYVDLGVSRKITRITFLSGDANHAYKIDVAVSPDDKTWTPVPGVQGFDTYKKWGDIVLPLRTVVEGRFIRLRHHKDGEKVTHFRMPCRLSVYDGVAGESFDLPKIGESLGAGELSIEIPCATPPRPVCRWTSPSLRACTWLRAASKLVRSSSSHISTCW